MDLYTGAKKHDRFTLTKERCYQKKYNNATKNL